MFGFCWHKWYIIKKYDDSIIKGIINNQRVGLHFDPDLTDHTYGPTYEEKICLKCKKYVDEITPRYLYLLKEHAKQEEREAEIQSTIAGVKKGRKRIWEK